MVIKYPLLIIILPIIIFLFLYFTKAKKKEKTKGSTIANTSFLKETDYYKKLLSDYKFYKTMTLLSFVVAIISSIILCSRLQRVETNNINEYKRDIVLCMDVSTSVDDLNMRLVSNLKNTVKSLKGERFGISIFNTTSVMVSPLTDDYEFILDSLDEIEKSIKSSNTFSTVSIFNDDYYYIRNFIYSGTIEGWETRGSSLIGDGLASCIYSFPRLKEDRSRTIIFSTDNELQGKPIISLEDAAKLSKKNNITVYGIGTKYMVDKNSQEFKRAVKITGGKYYTQSNSAVNSIVKDIEKSSKSLIDTKIETKQTDIPRVPFILLILSIGTIAIYSKKVIS